MPDAASATDSAALPSLESFKGRHQGQRCFVVGNAPSLARLDLTRLAGEVTFTANRGYLAASHGLPRGSYHVVSDPLTYEPYAAEIRGAAVGRRFYRADVCDTVAYRDAIDREPAIRVPFHRAPTMDEGFFSEDVSTGMYRGFTVLLDAIQLAFTMGFAKVYVVGCDLDYHQEQTHIYGTGPVEQERRHVMPIPRVLHAMRVAAAVHDAHGRVLANAGAGGKLDTIARVPFDSLFS